MLAEVKIHCFAPERKLRNIIWKGSINGFRDDAMASSKKRKVDKEGQKFNERWKFDYFLLRVAIIAFASFANSVMKE